MPTAPNDTRRSTILLQRLHLTISNTPKQFHQLLRIGYTVFVPICLTMKYFINIELLSCLCADFTKQRTEKRCPDSGRLQQHNDFISCFDLPEIEQAALTCQQQATTYNVQNLDARKKPAFLSSAEKNAPMESWFGTLKMELKHHRNYRTRREAIQ